MDDASDLADQLKQIYADWAVQYDHDNDHTLGTVSQPNAVAMLSRHFCEQNTEIIDVGCGTGLVGLHLDKAGFKIFDGIDLSPAMLEVAAARPYRQLMTLEADTPLPIADNRYDACLCVGVFTHNHLGPDGFDELVRITKPGGVVVFTVNEGVWQPEGFAGAIERLEREGVWSVLEQIKQAYMVNESVDAWYVAARKI